MGTLMAFEHVSVDGFFAGPHGEIDWFKSIGKDAEYERYTHSAAKGGSGLVLGRTTYELLKKCWPTPAAQKDDPAMARVVDESPKLVFSKKLKTPKDEPNWKNVTVVDEIDASDVAKRKEEAGRGLTILGSGSVVQQLAKLGLIDEYQFVVVPVVLGEGKRLFEGVAETDLKLYETKAFPNGVLVTKYRPA